MRAVFLDRDGVICEHRSGYVKSWDEFEFMDGSLEALRKLTHSNLPVIVVSNQSCIGRGIVTLEEVQGINRQMVEVAEAAGGRIDEVYICPHHPEDGCKCRKPGIGMLQKAASRHGINLDESTVVGDNITDIEMGRGAGCRTILVKTGLGKAFVSSLENPVGDPFIVKDLAEAVELVLLSQVND